MNRRLKVVILAGGFGTRIEEETTVVPKPLVRIGEYPILWHIMKIYSHYGFKDFIICLGYKGYMIKEYFANYFLHQCDVTFDFSKDKSRMVIHNKKADAWRVTLVDTGINTLTGGRIKAIKPYVKDGQFMLTYGDAVSDVNISALVKHHLSRKKIVTLTAVQPPGKFGVFKLGKDPLVKRFSEKPAGDGAWINGGFFVLTPDIFKYIDKGEKSVLEKDILEALAKDNQLMAYPHRGFWKCMDTLRDKKEIEQLWLSGEAPWKVWRD